MLMFITFFDPTRYTYGKGAKGRANIQLYFNSYSRGKRPALAKDIAVSTDYFFTILTKSLFLLIVDIFLKLLLFLWLLSYITAVICKQ